ncbi:short chain dehydrogenase domain-containing protein [Rhizoctonia solani AG-1 IA]|uniref:Short chain dehydrogenase domain-containing protein n=1 Tax=Thanatephorus cucumeris (strain AG1-IA) TaxID=983506 RepID=L8WEZ7_THACA|nr:short chain dehydrogenase domain-containing protein [Rhizoctonia solani AG-1 IA]
MAALDSVPPLNGVGARISKCSGTCKPKTSNFSTHGYMYLVDNHRDLLQLASAIIFNHFLYAMGSNLSQTFPPKPLFSVEQIPDLTGQVIIVTGGNAGLGKETCKALLNKNAKVYLAARSKSRADDAIEWLKSEANGKAPAFLELDLGNLASVRKAVEEFKSVDGLKSGVMAPPVEQRTFDGYDLQFGTNVLGHYFFTILLLPTLIHTAKNSPLASTDQHFERFGVSCTQGGDCLGNVRNRRIEHNSVQEAGHSYSICSEVTYYFQMSWPSAMPTRESFQAHSIPETSKQNFCAICHGWLQRFFLILYPASYGALTQLWSGTMPEGKDHNGKFLIPWARVGDAGANSHNEELAENLWNWLEEQVKGH